MRLHNFTLKHNLIPLFFLERMYYCQRNNFFNGLVINLKLQLVNLRIPFYFLKTSKPFSLYDILFEYIL